MTALKKEVFELVKREMKYVGILFLLSIVIFNIVFYKENFVVLIRNVLSLFWLFVLPGYFIMLYWNEKLEFAERFIIGIALSAAIIGIFSYYIGLVGLNIKYHAVVLPLVLLSISIAINLKRKNHEYNQNI